jgi:glyoxalase family protein
MARLGERLILPPWLEPHRPAIETGLPPLQMPEKEDPKGFANL